MAKERSMAKRHTNFKRIVHRSMEELNATMKIAKVTSWKNAMVTLIAKVDLQIMSLKKGYYESPRIKKHLTNKHKIMIDYYERTFSEFFENYSYNSNTIYDNAGMSDCIWVCWWQGLDNAPEIVKRCVESIRRNAGSHRVIILTDENYKDYVHIPKWIEEKRKKGIITKTNYSDLLRLCLLAEHGGMWLDATFYCTQCLDEYFNLPLWSIKRPDYAHASVASGYFAGYSLLCDSSHRWIFQIIRDFFLNYWKNNDDMVDYLMIDYMIVLAQQKDREIEEAFKKIPPNNPCCDELYNILGEPFDELTWKNLKKETSLFKLSWKHEFPKEKNGIETFYGNLLNGCL